MKPTKSSVLWTAIILVIAAVAVEQATQWRRASEIEVIDEQLRMKLDSFTDHLESQLQWYQILPNLVAQAVPVTKLVQTPEATDLRAAANRFLEGFNDTAHSSIIMLLDPHGLDLAASDWKQPDTSVGNKYGFRPYFKSGMVGSTGHYTAMGLDTKVVGYFVSRPIWIGSTVKGVIAVKYKPEDLLSAWHAGGDTIAVTDDRGIIFASSDPRLFLRMWSALSAAAKQEIAASRQYPADALLPLTVSVADRFGPVAVTRVTGAASPPRVKGVVAGSDRGPIDALYVVEQRTIPSTGWSVVALANVDHIGRFPIAIMLAGVLGALLALFLFVY
jgi:two-component system, NtrC family, C4-dicarboxylate transport sensor histidine kinase DctB